MQAKDIEIEELRRVVEELRATWPRPGEAFWSVINGGELPAFAPNVQGVAAVTGWPWKVVAAKVEKLLRQGVLVDGCGCGCGTWIRFAEPGPVSLQAKINRMAVGVAAAELGATRVDFIASGHPDGSL